MRRDMDLVRSILLKVGESEGCVDARDLLCDEYNDFEQIYYHVKIMTETGLISSRTVAKRTRGHQKVRCTIESITLYGNDLLNVFGNDIVWNKTKNKIQTILGDAPLEVYEHVAKEIIKDMVY